MKKLNFTGLTNEASESAKDVLNVKTYLKEQKNSFFNGSNSDAIISKVAPIITFIFVSVFVFGGVKQASNFILPLLILLVGTIGGFSFWRSRKKRDSKLERFAKDNNLIFQHAVAFPKFKGILFNYGDARLLVESLIFTEDYGQVEIGNHTAITGSGKNRSQLNVGFVRAKLPRNLPHLILDAKANNSLGMSVFTSTGNSLDNKIKLEGDFNNYFSLAAPKGYERDAYYVFTPDVMSTLVDIGKNYDFEIVDDELYIYGNNHFDITNPQIITTMLQLTEIIYRQVEKQARNYSDERVGTRTLNQVSESGKRISTTNKMSKFTIAHLLFMGIPTLLFLIFFIFTLGSTGLFSAFSSTGMFFFIGTLTIFVLTITATVIATKRK